jgi:predicted RNase H-like nuclease (RuvC/YqgF family)
MSQSKYSNSEIGSHHWAATLLSFVMRVGEYLEAHEDGSGIKPSERMHYQEWGTELKARAVEVNDYLQSLPDKPDASKEVLLKHIGATPEPIDKIFDSLKEFTLNTMQTNKEMLKTISELESILSSIREERDLLKEISETQKKTINGIAAEFATLKAERDELKRALRDLRTVKNLPLSLNKDEAIEMLRIYDKVDLLLQ